MNRQSYVKSLLEIQSEFKDYVGRRRSCYCSMGGYQLLGKYYKTDAGMIEGLNLVDIYTEQEEGRLIDNIVLDSDLVDMPVVGFENHGEEHTSMEINHLEKYYTEREMTGKAAMKA